MSFRRKPHPFPQKWVTQTCPKWKSKVTAARKSYFYSACSQNNSLHKPQVKWFPRRNFSSHFKLLYLSFVPQYLSHCSDSYFTLLHRPIKQTCKNRWCMLQINMVSVHAQAVAQLVRDLCEREWVARVSNVAHKKIKKKWWAYCLHGLDPYKVNTTLYI